MKWRLKQWTVTFFLILSALTQLAWASTAVHPKLILKSIKQVSAQESRDEIYFLVSDLNAKKKVLYTVPGHKHPFVRNQPPPHPNYSMSHPHQFWTDKTLSDVHNVTLWSRPLTNNTGTQLVISLIEFDTPPWDVDDTLGSIKLNLKNSNNQLNYRLIPYSNTQLIQQKKISLGRQYTIQFKDGHANYLVVIELIAKK